MSKDSTILIGYSGHAFVVADCILKSDGIIEGYCDNKKKQFNPFDLNYLGRESENLSLLKNSKTFIAIGDNTIRQKIFQYLIKEGISNFANVIHPSVNFGLGCHIGKGILFAPNAVINPISKIGNGVICNTGCIIEHECLIDEFVHIAPGAVLAGNVQVGKRTFIGANSVVKQGVKIGESVVIGAGSVIIKDVPNGAVVVGNPGRVLK